MSDPILHDVLIIGTGAAGLTAALYGEITIEKGRVKQANFNDYPMLRMRAGWAGAPVGFDAFRLFAAVPIGLTMGAAA